MNLPCGCHGPADLRPLRRPLPPAAAHAVPEASHQPMWLRHVAGLPRGAGDARCRPGGAHHERAAPGREPVESGTPFYCFFRSYRPWPGVQGSMPQAPHWEPPGQAAGPIPDRRLPDLSGVFKWCPQVINTPRGNARCPCAASHRSPCCTPCRNSSRLPCRPAGPSARGRRCLRAWPGGPGRRGGKRQGSRTADIAAVRSHPGSGRPCDPGFPAIQRMQESRRGKTPGAKDRAPRLGRARNMVR